MKIDKFRICAVMTCCLFCGSITAGVFQGNFELDDYVRAEDTIIYRVKNGHKQNQKQTDILKLASDAVGVAYNGYKTNFDHNIAQEKERLAGMGAINSSAYSHVIIRQVESFASTIINQIETVANKLSHNDKQAFWSVSEQEIKQILTTYCENQGASSTESLFNHINSLINMKKTFG